MTKYILPVIASPRVRSAINDLLKQAGYDTIGAATTVNRALKDMRNTGSIALIVAEAPIPGASRGGTDLYQMTRGAKQSCVTYDPSKGYRNTPFILITHDPEKTNRKLESVSKNNWVHVLRADSLQTTDGCQAFLDTVRAYMPVQ